jgi:hypothetical protein
MLKRDTCKIVGLCSALHPDVFGHLFAAKLRFLAAVMQSSNQGCGNLPLINSMALFLVDGISTVRYNVR